MRCIVAERFEIRSRECLTSDVSGVPAEAVQGVRVGQVDGLENVRVEERDGRAQHTESEPDGGGYADGKKGRSAKPAKGVAKICEHGRRGRRPNPLPGSVVKTTLDLPSRKV